MDKKAKNKLEFIKNAQNATTVAKVLANIGQIMSNHEHIPRLINGIKEGTITVPVMPPVDPEDNLCAFISYCLEHDVAIEDADYYYVASLYIKGAFPDEQTTPYLKSLSKVDSLKLQKTCLKNGIKLGSQECLYLYCCLVFTADSYVDDFDPYFKMVSKIKTPTAAALVELRKCFKPKFNKY